MRAVMPFTSAGIRPHCHVGFAMLLMLAVLGSSTFDFGRIYIARNEAQLFTDAAAMTAASKLDGNRSGRDQGARIGGPLADALEPRAPSLSPA